MTARSAAEAALRGEHAAVYGYGVVGARIDGDRQEEARTAYDAHRARRDAMARVVRDLGGKPKPAAAAYALPFAVPDAAAAVRLAAELEDRLAGVYADLVRAGDGNVRADAAAALREAAVRAVRWRGAGVAFPGLAERAQGAAAPPSRGSRGGGDGTDQGSGPDSEYDPSGSESQPGTEPGAGEWSEPGAGADPA
ncbi:ferritin-like domain-containing protein [Streptomyces sp. A7024]|uniref:Ferritin-like domain-containing protein n=1 Tax=Streptomyces coryli TaxID=1128680 RepID=A0A6G4TXW3_9ACTN|nr:ferritin-like domain-containing protein [Streptomyces coryli]